MFLIVFTFFRYPSYLLRQTSSRFAPDLGEWDRYLVLLLSLIFYMKCSIQSGKTLCPVGTCYKFVWFFSLSLNPNQKLLFPYQAVMQYFPFISTVFLKVTSYSRNSLQKQLTTLDHKTKKTTIYCARRTIPLADTPRHVSRWKVYIVNII